MVRIVDKEKTKNKPLGLSNPCVLQTSEHMLAVFYLLGLFCYSNWDSASSGLSFGHPHFYFLENLDF